ncbi:MAG: UbiA family prenyltransferase [Planctomycetes bacterium]|nr:UbiA family prenyltransferase [Planctomycetota bacterium]
MPAPQGVIGTIKTYGSFVKFSHTVFALPFAITGMLVAYTMGIGFRDVWPSFVFVGDSIPGNVRPLRESIFPVFSVVTLALVFAAMVGARSFAMALNRILDRRIDASNPRTAGRELPSGRMTLAQAWAFAISAAILYFGACVALGRVTTALSPIPIALMTVYPFTKRFTSLCHFVLGASLGLAPVGAWVAVRAGGSLLLPDQLPELGGWGAVTEPLPWILGLGVMLWVAGFDIIYALQDDEFDRANKLHSFPAQFGRFEALVMSRIVHVFAAVAFVVFSIQMSGAFALSEDPQPLPLWTLAAPVIAIVGLIWQHRLVKPDDLSRVNVAFFTVNGIISALFGAVYVAGYIVWRMAN